MLGQLMNGFHCEVYNYCRILYRNTNNYISQPVYLCYCITQLSCKNITKNNLPTCKYIDKQKNSSIKQSKYKIKIETDQIQQSQMQQKKRPYSSKPISTIAFPHEALKSQNSSDQDMKLTQLVPNNPVVYGNMNGRNRLNQIIPELPQFGIKSNNTALLYSKFIVKGLKEDKISVVKSAFRKKQEVTQAATVYKNKNKSITRTKTGQLVDNFVCDDQTEENNHNVQLNTLLRASSAKVFRKTTMRQQSIIDNEYIERKLSKNKTQTNLMKASSKKRPTTAKLFRQKDSRFSHAIQQQSKTHKETQRPTTALNSRQTKIMTAFQPGIEKSMYTQQLANLVDRKIKDRPIRVETVANVDHIQRNKQNISSYNRKASSIYLTNTNLEQVMKNRKESIRKSQLKQQQKNSTISQLDIKPQQIFKQEDRKKHQQKLHKIQNYLQQSLPSKLQLVTQQLRRQSKKAHIQQINQNYQQLLSINLDNRNQQNHEQLNQRSAKACFDDYIQSCQILQYNISSKMKSEHFTGGDYATLNICQCQQVIQIYKNMTVEKNKEKKMKMVEEIRALTKNLKYFSHKPKQEIDKFFTIPFEIVIADEQYVVIELNSTVENIYIILNGSALVQTNTNNQYELPSKNFSQKLLNTQHSLYDGEIFGEPSKPSQKHYKMRVTILEQSLLLKIKYEDYIAKFFQGSEVEQKLDVLNVAFKMEINRGFLTEQDLQILSLSLEKHRYASKSLIYRQGQIFDKLVLVAKGKLAAINEYILDQDKVQSSDMKELDKNIRQQKQNTLFNQVIEMKRFIQPDLQVDKLTVQKMRRQNLINYEVLRQDNKKIQYYFMKEQMQFVKGDSINWKPLFIEFNSSNKKSFSGQNPNKNIIVPIKPVSFSLMSNSNDTEVYFLSRSAFQYLPSNIKKVLLTKGQEQQNKQIKPQTEKQIKNWNNFKQKLCNSIIKQSKDKKSRNKF